MPDDSFEHLKKKLFVTATDVLKSESVVFSSGELSRPVIASASVPLVFEPVLYNGYTLLDGGILNNFPIEPLLPLCNKIIGVHVNPINKNLKEVHMKDIMDRSFHMALSSASRSKIAKCDIYLEPSDLYQFGMFDISKADQIFEIGYQYTLEREEKILSILS
jgi:NTE family protein